MKLLLHPRCIEGGSISYLADTHNKNKDVDEKQGIANFDILMSVGYWSHIQLKLFKQKLQEG